MNIEQIKNWNNLSIWKAQKSITYLLERTQKKGAIPTKIVPHIIYGHIFESAPESAMFHNITNLFKFSNTDTQINNHIRVKVLECFYNALKCHTFLFEKDMLLFEPYFTLIPDFQDMFNIEIGLYYPLSNNRVIFSTTSNLLYLSEHSKENDFNSVLPVDINNWYSVSFWNNTVKNAVRKDLSNNNISYNPWNLNDLKSIIDKARKATTEEEIKKYAILLDIDKNDRDLFKPLGTTWNNDLKTWFLPKGFETSTVKDYILFIKNNKKQ